MANYYCSARTNYFGVKDMEKFKEWANGLGLEVIGESVDTHGLVGLLPDTMIDTGFPDCRMSEEGEANEIDFPAELAGHLLDGDVAIIMESGAEKLRYIAGSAVAINSKGETAFINLEHIYEKAKALGTTITRCEY